LALVIATLSSGVVEALQPRRGASQIRDASTLVVSLSSSSTCSSIIIAKNYRSSNGFFAMATLPCRMRGLQALATIAITYLD
jgi:hypothetical protein